MEVGDENTWFTECLQLDRIRFEGDEVPEIGNYSLPFLESITEIMVPKGKLSLYKAKYQDYQSIIIETP